MRYYLDVAPVIYLIEQSQSFATAVRSKAAAVISNRDVFMTNDQRLNRFTGITIETI
jgi:hypothetical protein